MWEWGAHVCAEQSPEESVIFWNWGYSEPPCTVIRNRTLVLCKDSMYSQSLESVSSPHRVGKRRER